MKNKYGVRSLTAIAILLCAHFGRDDNRFSHTRESVGGATRSYPGFAAIANEQERARIWGGIHFAFDNVSGQSIGRNVGTYVFQNIMQPRRCVQ